MLFPKDLISSYLSDNKDECMKEILQAWLAKSEAEMKPIISSFLNRLENKGRLYDKN